MAPPTASRLTRAEQREQTRGRLLDAAEELFAARGIDATPIEEIADGAGFSRGAFYSNFDGKADLVLALLARFAARNTDELAEMFETRTDAADFFDKLRTRELDTTRGVMSLEFVLYAVRNPEARPALAESMEASRALTRRLVVEVWDELGADLPVDPAFAARVLQALDDGIGMLRFVEPESYPHGMYSEALAVFQDMALALAAARRSGGPAAR